jgi:LPXTG-site transpeptidase (sortase) family protein
VYAVDAAGNVDATPASYTWTVDATAPNTTITSTTPATSPTTSTTMDIAFNSTEAGTFQCRLDGGAYALCTSPRNLTGLANGAHTFDVYAVDAVGNADTTPASYTWTVDSAAPNTTITSTTPATSPTNSTAMNIVFSSTEAGTFQCSLDGGTYVLCTSPANFIGLADGSHTFDVYAVDTAGNVDPTPASYTWTVDTTAPTVSITSGPTSPTNNTSASFVFITGGSPTAIDCQLDGSAFAACDTGTTHAYAGLTGSPAPHVFTVRVTDAAGNATSDTYNWTVDITSPTVDINQHGIVDPTNVSPIVFDVVFGESVADFDASDVTITGMAGAPGVTVSAGPGTNYTVSVTGMVSGETVTATIAAGGAHDNVGNANLDSKSTDNQVTYDTSLPTVSITSTATNPTGTSPIPVTFTFNETVTGFDISDLTVGNGSASNFVPVSGTVYTADLTPAADGPVTVDIAAGAAQDGTGNDNTAASYSITYDTTAPQVASLSVADAGDGILTYFEVVTTSISQLTVKFSEDVYNPGGTTDPKSVTNPENYMLIRDLGDTAGFQTKDCAGKAVVPADTKMDVTSVSYDAASHTATFTINGGLPLSNGNYRLYVCGTTSITDLVGIELNNTGAGGRDFTLDFSVQISDGNGGNNGGDGSKKAKSGNTTTFSTSGLLIPVTGFAPDQVTLLPAQPADKAYKPMNEMRIEIPTLGIDFPIVGAAATDTGWDLSWLQNSVAYLEGSAYPTWTGNTVLTGHVTDANNNIGPFSDIKGMQLGQRIYIHFNGQVFVYEVQENKKISPTDISTVFKHEDYDWITLVTCEDYNKKVQAYKHRRMVRAVLISVIPE